MNRALFKGLTAALLSVLLIVPLALAISRADDEFDPEADIGFRLVVVLDEYTVTPGPGKEITGTAKLVYYNKDYRVIPEEDWPTSAGEDGTDYATVASSYPLTVTMTKANGTTKQKTVASGGTFEFNVGNGQSGTTITVHATGGPAGTPASIPQEVTVL